MKKSRKFGEVVVVYSHHEKETAEWISEVCDRAVRLSQEKWGLGPPEKCRIYIMTSWLGFVFQSAPWSWKMLLAATFPLWAFRAAKTWPYSAGWTQKYGKKITIGIKPPRLIEKSKKGLGIRMFVEEKDAKEKIQHVACHELVHACSAFLRLPAWLNEGIATVSVDQFLGKQTIRQDTLNLIRDFQPKAPPPTYRKLSRMGAEEIVYQSTRGYWLVRYMEENFPGFLEKLFSQHQNSKPIEIEIIRKLTPEGNTFWEKIDRILFEHFKK
ncbi:MAG: hypothetical protein JXB26_11600 [Candidatus Aminicenantes bacterium]|nr:hypothetical protein [Candidatus Aminicenantes bacterium]